MESPQGQNRRLDSWKEIAAFFDRDERTVKRWEKERALPVHRVPGSSRGGVFAYTAELAQWLRGVPVGELSTPEALSLGGSGTHSNSGFQGSSVAVAVKLQPAAHSVPDQLPPTTPPVVPTISAWSLALRISAGLFVILLVSLAVVLESHRASKHAAVPLKPVNPANSEAQELYLKGRYFWTKRTPGDLNQAVDYFASAIVKDPNYAPAYVGLADCYNLLREYSVMPEGEAFPRALAAAKKAVELDDNSAEAHNSLAFATFYGTWDAVTAEREFKKAIELDPNYVPAHHWYATFLLAIGRSSEALVEIDRARNLEPSSAPILADKGAILYNAGQQEAALDLLKQLETTEPNFLSPHSYLANIYFGKQDYPDFILEAKKTATLLHDNNALAVANAAEKGFAKGGATKMLERMLAVRQELYAKDASAAYPLAQLSALLHRSHDATTYLQTSYGKREIQMLQASEDPSLSSMKGDPIYEDLIAKIKHSR